MLCCHLLTFFDKINFFKKIFQEHYQSIKRFGSILSGLIWVQTVCKGYQQTAKSLQARKESKTDNRLKCSRKIEAMRESEKKRAARHLLKKMRSMIKLCCNDHIVLNHTISTIMCVFFIFADLMVYWVQKLTILQVPLR